METKANEALAAEQAASKQYDELLDAARQVLRVRPGSWARFEGTDREYDAMSEAAWRRLAAVVEGAAYVASVSHSRQQPPPVAGMANVAPRSPHAGYHADSLSEGCDDVAPAAGETPTAPRLICPQCGVNRYAAPCPTPGPGCPIAGHAFDRHVVNGRAAP